VGRAHHHALDHRLAADEGLLAALKSRQKLDARRQAEKITRKHAEKLLFFQV